MTTIAKGARHVTFIDVFMVEPINQQRLIELLTQVAESFARTAQGFVSGGLHRSLDGTKVTLYAQWQTMEDHDAMPKDPTRAALIKEAHTIACPDPIAYEVVETFSPPAGRSRASA
jgi:hypothetical protein